MNIKQQSRRMISALLVSMAVTVSHAQLQKQVLTGQTELSAVNRKISLLQKEGRTVVHSDAKSGTGIIWINKSHFSTGVIEADMKGKNVLQQSFVGIAFDGLNDSTYEAVYFRPFNFRSADPSRRKHAVQYISLPLFDWSFLREKFPGQYENGLNHPPDPDEWFHVRILLTSKKMKVYVNNDKKPSLSVSRLPGNKAGKLGFWLGNNSDGDFMNLTITNQFIP
jgi:hypothetical protein